MNVQIIEFQLRGDHRGSLVVLEGARHLPFAVARVYYIFGTVAGVVRGLHSHRKLNQVCVAVAGSCRMVLDNGREKTEVALDRPTKGLVIGPGLWREIKDFSPDCVLLVLADREYDETDYIRDYQIFLATLQDAPPEELSQP